MIKMVFCRALSATHQPIFLNYATEQARGNTTNERNGQQMRAVFFHY